MRRLLLAAIAAMVLAVAAPAAGVAPGSTNRPTIVLTATFVPARFLTRYQVEVEAQSNVADFEYRTARVTWRMVPPANDADCNQLSRQSHRTRGHGRIFRVEAHWLHGDQHGCDHRKEGPRGHRGTVAATVRISGWLCTISYAGTINGRAAGACRAS